LPWWRPSWPWGSLAISSRLEHGLDAGGFLHPFSVIRRNGASIGLFAVMLAFLLSVWERMSALLVGLFVEQDLVVGGHFSLGLLFDTSHLGFVLAYVLFGAVLASLVFILTVITLPLLIDRPMDLVTAMMTSLHAVARNPAPLLFWAMLIVLHVLAGLATAMVGAGGALPHSGPRHLACLSGPGSTRLRVAWGTVHTGRNSGRALRPMSSSDG
jgi:uncharacterized membrane protein